MRRIIGMIVAYVAASARANNTAATSAPSSRCSQPPTASARRNIMKDTSRMTGCMASYRKTGHVMDGKECRAATRSGELLRQSLRFLLLLRIALGHHFLEDVPRAVVITHVDIGAGKVQLGAHDIGAGEEIGVVQIEVHAEVGERGLGLPGRACGLVLAADGRCRTGGGGGDGLDATVRGAAGVVPDIETGKDVAAAGDLGLLCAEIQIEIEALLTARRSRSSGAVRAEAQKIFLRRGRQFAVRD